MQAYGCRDFTLITCPKVASTSIARWMADRGIDSQSYESWHDRPAPVVAIIREPIDRVLSCFRFFSDQPKGFPAPLGKGVTFEDFVEHVFESVAKGTANHHWSPQLRQIPRADVFVPYELLNTFWEQFMGPPGLPMENRTEPRELELEDGMLAMLEDTYRGDREAHAAALANADVNLETLEWQLRQPV